MALTGCCRVLGGDSLGNAGNKEIQIGSILNEDSAYRKEVQKILEKTCGANLYLQRKMLLANIANNYWEKNSYVIDSCLPIIEVLFLREQGDYDIYCIGQIPPCFMIQGEYTEMDVCGEYVVAYRIKGDSTMTESEIKQAGILTDCEMVLINELSYFVALERNTLEHHVVTNVISEWGGFQILDSIINSSGY